MSSRPWSRSFGTNTDLHWIVSSSQTPHSICLRTSLVWKEYILNKPWKSSKLCGASTVNIEITNPPILQAFNTLAYKQAISIGQQVLQDQGSKAAAALEIFKILKDESRDVVLQAFIEGANITPKGSPTYYYNVTRKLRKLKVMVWSSSISWDNGSGVFKEYQKNPVRYPSETSGMSGWKHPLQPSIWLTVETRNHPLPHYEI